MPIAVKHIDKIARKKNRDVLYIAFNKPKKEDDSLQEYYAYEFENDPVRDEFIKWLDENNIPYEMCGPIAREDGWEKYMGQLYIDIPMDENDKRYVKLNEHLEDKEGNMKINGIYYHYVPVEIAMKNTHHDKPGFWDKWAEEF